MSTMSFQCFCHFYVIVQRVLGPFRIQNISGVTYGGFTQGIGFQNGIHRHFHVCDPVKRVEDTEYIYTAFCCLFDECLDDIIRVVGITTPFDALSSIWKRMLGASFRMDRRRSHGHSVRNLMAVSKVAPPHISSEKKSAWFLE